MQRVKPHISIESSGWVPNDFIGPQMLPALSLGHKKVEQSIVFYFFLQIRRAFPILAKRFYNHSVTQRVRY